MFDRHTELDLLLDIGDVIDKYAGKPAKQKQDSEIKLTSSEKPFAQQKFKERACADCRRAFIPESPAQKTCNYCRKSPVQVEELQEALNEVADNLDSQPVQEEIENG
jgi:hypothetical protein